MKKYGYKLIFTKPSVLAQSDQLISKEDMSDQDITHWRLRPVYSIKVLKWGTDLLSSNCWCGCLSGRQRLRLLTDSAEC